MGELYLKSKILYLDGELQVQTVQSNVHDMGEFQKLISNCILFCAANVTDLKLSANVLQCTLYSVHSAVYTVQCALYSVHCAVCTVQFSKGQSKKEKSHNSALYNKYFCFSYQRYHSLMPWGKMSVLACISLFSPDFFTITFTP